MSLFINRRQELTALNQRHDSGNPEFLLVYGRRRVGKTALIKEFCKNKKYIYYLCSQENDLIQIKKIAKRIAESFDEMTPLVESWEDLFEYISQKSKERLILVIDEFPYLMGKNKAMASLFQMAWDEYFKDTNIFLILCGSSISMMEDLLDYKSPLYGRRTGQIELLPMFLKNVFEFFPKYNLGQKIQAHSILGNIPMYLLEFDDKKSIRKNIEENILRQDKILYKEPLFLLKQELRDTGTYLTLLEQIKDRPLRMSILASKSNIDVNKLPKYLSVLSNLRFVKKIIKVTEKKVKTKNTHYVISDNYFKFWFRFIYPNLSEIEGGDKDKIAKLIYDNLDSYIGYVFEGISKEFLIDLNRKNKLKFHFEKIGNWWGHYKSDNGRKEVELDLVALNEDAKEIGFFECKWMDLGKNKALDILEKLKQKSYYVQWRDESRKEHFGLIARKIEGKDELRKSGFVVFDLDDF
ncbi:MAG: ATP-binding protein [Candidatus Aenigmarchaeota archaeon]|nr:ATP-binding protein [Candidatus Aenigmarchaeota archaeon]